MDPALPRNAGEGAQTRSRRAGEGIAAGDTIAGTLASAGAALAAAGFDEPRRPARRLLAVALDLSAAQVFAHPERVLSAVEQLRVADMLGRMLAHEPLSRIVGRREFWGLEFRLSRDTLDPRPETEIVVEAVLARSADRALPYRFLDLGTGTGCLLLALLHRFPRAVGIGIDIAEGAARTARDNARSLDLAGRARFVVGDWATALDGRFDVIVANPPYIASAAIAALPPEVRGYDPHRALDGGADGLAAYRAIAGELPRLLAPSGIFAAELGDGQSDDVAAMLANAALALDGVLTDLAGIPRCIVARRAIPTAPALGVAAERRLR